MKKFLLLAAPAFLLTGCIGELIALSCLFTDDADHCYQAAAVQDSDPDDCKKVAGEGFSGSNPPQDKCYKQIAENTGDPSVCERMEGGFMSYSPEECMQIVLRNGSPEKCAEAADPDACRNVYARNGRGCGDGYDFKNGACSVHTEEPDETTEKSALNDPALADIQSMKDAATGKYMELLEQDIDGETDPGRLAGLQAYKDFLDKAGETIDTAQASLEKLEQLKKIFVDSYDPSMDIDRMKIDDILGPGLFDRINSRIFGDDPPTERGNAESALTVYEAMLKQQADIDFLKKNKLGRLGETVSSMFKDEVTGKVTDGAKEIAEGIAGTAFSAVGIVGDALNSFQEEAQKEMFVGLAAAYNRRRADIERISPGLSAEEVHKRTVEQVKDDPYQDNVNTGFVKYGNILENKDCQDEGNPLCIDNRVFWTAMDKTWQYQHK